MAMNCTACGHENRAEARFCDQCGSPLQQSSAGAYWPAATPAEYTPKHLADRVLTSRSAIEGERKHVTVVFVDCVGFTPMAEQLDPEDLHGIMDRCFEVLLGEIHRFEGTVNQFTGDGIMALFGAPLALEDAPRRAVMAALSIQDALQGLHADLLAERGIDFRVRIGIHSGPVVVGKIGNDLRMDYTAIGDTVNLAARLQARAKPGTVMISDATKRLVEGFFELVALGLIALKGKAEPVHAFEVVAERSTRGRIDAVIESGLTPLVGRARDLETLIDAYARARSGQGQVAFVVGEAGIGKSRLLYELRRSIAGDSVIWIEGRCASYGNATAFLAVGDALRRYYGIEDRDAEAAATAKIDNGIAALGGDLGWTIPYIRQLLALPTGSPEIEACDAATRRSETFRALKAATLQATRNAPLVLVFEDLHWIDPASEEFVSFLADAVPGIRCLLICSHRPGYRQPFGDRSYHTRITLGALSAGEMTTMTEALLGTADMPAELRALIAAKAEGNPFFMEEVAQSLLEEGALRRDGGRIVLTRPLDEIIVPDRIHDVIMARIDRLPEDHKHAIQVASVIGREFALRLLRQLTEVGDAASELVAELRALELIYEKTAHPELAYMFKHALTHDVAYESILLQRRRGMHRTIGLAIEELYADRLAEHYETLAHHFTRGEDWERAFDYHVRAADKSMSAYATHAAVEHCRQALGIAERLGAAVSAEQRRTLELRFALGSFYISDFRSSAEAYRRAAQRAPGPAERAADLGLACNSFTWAHEFDAAGRCVNEAIDLARKHDLRTVEQVALGHRMFLGVVLNGDVASSLPIIREASRIVAASGDAVAAALIGSWEIELVEWSADFPRAVELSEQLIPLGRRLSLAHLVIWPAWFGGKAECCLGNYGRAIARLTDALELTDRIGDRAWKTRILNTLGWCYAELGSHEHARSFNERAAAIAHEMADAEITGNAEINLGVNWLALDDTERARSHLEPIHEHLTARSPFSLWRYSMHLFDALGHTALRCGDPETALAHGSEELTRARRHFAPKVEARALDLRGRALLAMDRRDEAEAALAEAVTVADRIGYPRIAWQALLALAATKQRAGAAAAATALAHRSQAIVDNLLVALPDPDLAAALRGEFDRRVAGLPR